MMFRILLDDMIKAESTEELTDLMYRHDGITMAYRFRRLTEDDYKRLVQLYRKLMEMMDNE